MSVPSILDAEILIFPDQTTGEIHDRLFGQFIEITGRCINKGLYDPGSPLAREDGLRIDVVDALKELRPSYIRYPGGCGTAYFNWQELVGPVHERPRSKLFRETCVPQSTAFGIPEAWSLCQEVGAELYLAVNANTQSPEDAANLVEYLNGTTLTKWADLRRTHGRDEPYHVKYFGLGNEIYGDWQPGQKTASEYARWCHEAIHQMKLVDPSIEIITCGFGRFNPAWDRTLLHDLADRIDMISVHNYFGRPIFRDSMAASLVCEQMLNQMSVNIDEMLDAHLDIKTRPGIAFDEWNVWYRATHNQETDGEEIYNYTDALTVASLMHVIFRNARLIRMANSSLFVNVLGAVFTDSSRSVRQTIFYPQQLLHNCHHGRVVKSVVDAPTFSAKHERFFCGIVDTEKAKDESVPTLLHFTDVPALDVVVSVDDVARKVTMSIVQKLEDTALRTHLTFRGLQPAGKTMIIHRLTGGEDLLAENTLDHPDRVQVVTENILVANEIILPPASLTVLEYTF